MTEEKGTAMQAGALAVTYLRVSTKEQAQKGGQAEGFSIPAQREALRRKAETLNAAIVAEFVDAGESAKSADRPDLKRMLTYLATHRVDYVLVHKIDRLARNRVDDIEITMAIKKAGATLVSATENIDETPSGMLLHGIMSSIAEFYSRNLATEVHKGMSQKAIAGGTPGRVPLGYRNVGRTTDEGREERTVEIDPERADLIVWAYAAYATGEWTLRSMADELEVRGLTTRKTPKLAARPVKPNVLHAILTNPYYKGEVIYRGVSHPGRHQPLTDPATWEKVQDVFASHLVGEKQREHPHYLKSSVFCGTCGSRLIITNAKNRHGTVYPYFVCLGRHQKTTTCTRKAMLTFKVEKLIEKHWATIQLEPALRDALERTLRELLVEYHKQDEEERRLLKNEHAKLTAQRQKLVEAIYSGAMPLDLIAGEQERIGSRLAAVQERLDSATTATEKLEENLAAALNLAGDCHAAYRMAEPSVRRMFNQAFFTHLVIGEDDGVHGHHAVPFDVLLAPEVLDTGRAVQADSEVGTAAMAALLGRTSGGGGAGANQKTPRALRAAGGLGEPSAPGYRGEGSKTTTLVPPAGFEPATPALGVRSTPAPGVVDGWSDGRPGALPYAAVRPR
ncbi:recombinase family protein [Streptomyces sp. NPDC094038]|uniref:recombinase family protein n=1 Tax=Streptomyces sp. NPDC094038 TaxID=3366055 RepID=UPI00382F46E0